MEKGRTNEVCLIDRFKWIFTLVRWPLRNIIKSEYLNIRIEYEGVIRWIVIEWIFYYSW